MRTILFLLVGFIIMMIMGTVYTWSVFRVEVETIYQANTLQSGVPYMISLFFYAVFMMLTGRVLTNKNTRLFAFTGVLLISAGWFLASISESLVFLSLSYGVLIGSGVGIVYGIPIYIINKRYTNSGLYTGIVLSGFGASPLVTAPVIHYLIQTTGITYTFFVMGVVSIGVLTPLILTLKVNENHKTNKPIVEKDYSPKIFWLLYVIFLIATTIGLMIIGLTYRIGVLNYGFNANNVTLMVSVFAVFNGLSRPIFGQLVDKKGFLYASRLSASLIIIAAVGSLLNQGNILLLYGASMGIFWFNLGAFLAMMPASIKLYFGTHLYAKRYGLMFTSYGLGAIIGTFLSGILLDIFFETYFLYGLILLLIIIVLFLLKLLKQQTLIPKQKDC